MISNTVYQLCHSTESVSSALGNEPDAALSDIIQRLYPHQHHHSHSSRPSSHHSKQFSDAAPASPTSTTSPVSPRSPNSPHLPSSTSESSIDEDLKQVASCGNWGPTEPSPLFLKAFADSLNCLENDPLASVVSPPLMGTHGTIPLTAIAPLADIIRHCSNLIARAEREVFFITCTWSPSVAQRLIKESLIELSRRAGDRGRRVVVKMMYDKAGPMNLVSAHQNIKPSGWTGKGVQLPSPEEIPNLDLEIVSLHTFPLGTLHAKFCIIDRKMAVVMSNNVEDNPNMEMMTHLEGPVVDSIYDTALITWNKAFHPPLPSINSPATAGGLPTDSGEPTYLDRGPGRDHIQVAEDGQNREDLEEHAPSRPHYDRSLTDEITRMQACYSVKSHETSLAATNRELNVAIKSPIPSTGPEIPPGEEMTPYIATSTTHAVPMAIVSRPPYGPMDSSSLHVPQNEAWLSLIRNATSSIFIQTPDLNAAPLIPAIKAALKRGVKVVYFVCFGYNDAGELIPGQGGTNDQVAHSLMTSLNERERSLLFIYNYVAKDQDHPIHQSFKTRACHIKLLIVDNQVGVMGSGNQDTQSWFHSQEINVMIDSNEICEKWLEGIRRNQNTETFGKVSEDGVWRDENGKPGEGYMGNPGTFIGLVKGVYGMAMKWKAQ